MHGQRTRCLRLQSTASYRLFLISETDLFPRWAARDRQTSVSPCLVPLPWQVSERCASSGWLPTNTRPWYLCDLRTGMYKFPRHSWTSEREDYSVVCSFFSTPSNCSFAWDERTHRSWREVQTETRMTKEYTKATRCFDACPTELSWVAASKTKWRGRGMGNG